MPSKQLWIQWVLSFLMAMLCFSALFNNNIFGNPTYASFFYYTICASITIVVIGIIILMKVEQPQKATIDKIPFFLFGSICLYYLFQPLFISDALINERHTLLITNFLLFLALSHILNRFIGINQIGTVLAFAAFIESWICILQSLGLFSSNNKFFAVTGSWSNPNVTAMFLTMSVPLILGLVKSKTAAIRNVVFSTVALLLIAIVLLRCRTAFIGLIPAIWIPLNTEYSLFHRLKKSVKKTKLMLLIVVIIVISSVGLGISIYNAKKTSSDGRVLVWKITTSMISENPLHGVGYGRFEHAYNLQQAKYFEKGKASEAETDNAAFVTTAYNELLETTAEGGVVAMVLIISFLVSVLFEPLTALLKGSKDNLLNNRSEYGIGIAGVACFAIMGLSNFVVQAIPAMLLLVLYLSLIQSLPKNTQTGTSSPNTQKKLFKHSFALDRAIPFLLVLSGIYLFSIQTSSAKSYAAFADLKNSKQKDVIKKYQNLEPAMNISESFWADYGYELYKRKEYQEALDKYLHAIRLSSNPMTYLHVGDCLMKLNENDRAEEKYRTAMAMVPNLMGPRYALMKFNMLKGDTSTALVYASQLIQMRPKVDNEKAEKYKDAARDLIEKTIKTN